MERGIENYPSRAANNSRENRLMEFLFKPRLRPAKPRETVAAL